MAEVKFIGFSLNLSGFGQKLRFKIEFSTPKNARIAPNPAPHRVEFNLRPFSPKTNALTPKMRKFFVDF